MKKVLLFIFLFPCIIACNNRSASTEPTQSDSMQVMIPKSGCYGHFENRDTILLKMEVFPNVVTGTLKYHLYEKDRNDGTIEGTLQNDTLYADYTFLSEGITSIREVAFLIQHDEIVEGWGDQIEKDGKMVFKDKSHIKFDKGLYFTKIDCVENDEQFHVK